jgi:predicted Zn-dependent protease
LAIGPRHTPSRLLYEKAQQFKEAVEVLQQGRKRIPGSLNFLLPLGNNLVWAEQYQAGIDVLNELIRRQPDAVEAYVRLAEAYRNTGHPELETKTLRALARVKPDYPMVHILTARAMMTMDPVDPPGVMAELAQAEKGTPGDPDIFYIRGKVYIAPTRMRSSLKACYRATSHGSALLPAWPDVPETRQADWRQTMAHLVPNHNR